MLKHTDKDDTAEHENEDQEGSELRAKVDREKMARKSITAKWLELWSLYKTRPIKVTQDDGWQAKLNDGRTFELVETVAGYIRNALFFSDRWAQLEATEPGLAEVVPLVSTYFVDCLNASNLKREFRVFLTQLLLTGFSGIIPYWCDESDALMFKAVNSYDLHIESSQRYDERFSYSFRDVQLNYAEFCSWVEDGLLELTDADEAWNKYAKSDNTRQAELYNLRDIAPVTSSSFVLVTEYYCPEEKEIYRLIDSDIVYDGDIDECPWLVGLLFETPEESYALSLIESSIGLILANNILHNRRLDNMALSIDNMWMFIDDGVTNPSDIKTEPGKVIVVGRPDSLIPLRPPANNFNVTYQEAQVLDTKIDRNIGTGAMISANTYRNAERVTAQEIESVKDAGGNRLNDLYEHLEATVIIPLLKRCYKIIKENTKRPKVVKLASSTSSVYDYFRLLPSDLSHDFKIKVSGTQSVINRDRNVSLIKDFIALAGSVPQFQQLVDWQNVYFDLLVKFGFDDPQRYMVKPQEDAGGQQQPTAPQSPLQAMQAKAQDIGGNPMANALTTRVAQGQAPQMAMDLAGMTPDAQAQVTPDQLQAATATMSTPLQ
jgi:hypothetical protein